MKRNYIYLLIIFVADCLAAEACIGNGGCDINGTCLCFPGFDSFSALLIITVQIALYVLNSPLTSALFSLFFLSYFSFIFPLSPLFHPLLIPFLTILLLCDATTDCVGNGECTPSGRCLCDNGWNGDDCSVRSFPPSSCNVSASLVARLGGNWTINDSSYQLFGIILYIYNFCLFSIIFVLSPIRISL